VATLLDLLDGGVRRRDHARLDAELAEPQAPIGLELDQRRGQQREALPAGVLEEVGLELLGERLLVVTEPLAVARREVDPVLVGHVGARQRRGLVQLHLARELAREFDGPHL
jgi:hypothetical protein